MKVPKATYTSRPWRLHAFTRDFQLEDVWQLPTPGGAGDFPKLVKLFAGGSTAHSSSRLARALFALRWKLGALFGWDNPASGVGTRVKSLRDRLPFDLKNAPAGPAFSKLPFTSVYLTDDEWLAEMANKTVHALMHMSWAPDSEGIYHGYMTVLVKPNGWFGRLYMAAIDPFRYLIVYPPLMRRIRQTWATLA